MEAVRKNFRYVEFCAQRQQRAAMKVMMVLGN